MQIVINLSDKTYKDIKEENGIYGTDYGLSPRITGKVVGAIQSGTPLPEETIKALEQEPNDMCEYATRGGCQYEDIEKIISTEGKPWDDFLSREERLKMLMETGEFDFLKDISPDKIWKLVFMLNFIGDVESEKI